MDHELWKMHQKIVWWSINNKLQMMRYYTYYGYSSTWVALLKFLEKIQPFQSKFSKTHSRCLAGFEPRTCLWPNMFLNIHQTTNKALNITRFEQSKIHIHENFANGRSFFWFFFPSFRELFNVKHLLYVWYRQSWWLQIQWQTL